MKYSFLFFLGLSVGKAFCQIDDSLNINRIGFEDLTEEFKQENVKIVSFGKLIDSEDQESQEIYIIEGVEIRKYGYSTLVDVLENIPGIRVSQPGNAFEGETFLMRGLLGNEYVRFMINGIPIKPEAVRGMPIGSQLPVRNAERIEIILGPNSASYGADVMAGVINIVLPGVHRPVFAWGDINISNPNISDINLTLGGKAGKGEKTINYQFFATAFRAIDVPLLIPDDSIIVDLTSLSPYELQQFRSDTTGLAERDDFMRESRLLGVHVRYKGFEILAMNMSRQEHSSLGFHPLERAYNNPSLNLGERMTSVSVQYHSKGDKKIQSSLSLGGLTYRVIPNSAYVSVLNRLSRGRNFIYGRSVDFSFNGQLKYLLSDNIQISAGASVDYSISHPFTQYLLRPNKSDDWSFNLNGTSFESAVQSDDSVFAKTLLAEEIPFETFSRSDASAFSRFNFHNKKKTLFINAAFRLAFNSFQEVIPLPYLGIRYNPLEKLSLSANYGRAYRLPRSYFVYNSYLQLAQPFAQGNRLERTPQNLRSEILDGLDAKAEFKPLKNWTIGAQYFAHWMTNKLYYHTFRPTPGGPPVPTDSIGFLTLNSQGSSFLTSFSFFTNAKFKTEELIIDLNLSAHVFSGKEQFLSNVGQNTALVESEKYRLVPDNLIRGVVNLQYKNSTISFRYTYFSSFLASIYRINDELEANIENISTNNFDILIHQKLFRQLSVFGGVYNVMNSVQSGIPSVELVRTWNFNPQYGRFFKIGLNFQLN